MARHIQINAPAECTGCEACVNACPVKCISFTLGHHGCYFPQVDETRCISCGKCIKVCPVIHPEDERVPIAVYAAVNKSPEKYKSSSSAGTFRCLAENVIKKGGVVFGAKFDSEFNVVHAACDSEQGVEAFSGSKYVQSRIGQSYKVAKTILDAGKTVLFSGTPCQIAGLRKFLGQEYPNLITVDIVCHGVPSPMIWSEYFKKISTGFWLKKNPLSFCPQTYDITHVDFRAKDDDWFDFKLAIHLKKHGDTQCRIQKESANTNLYMQGFLKDWILRDSCYKCPSKLNRSHSDITLCDYWGIRRLHPEFDSHNSVAIAMANTKKGNDLLMELPINYQKHTFTDVLRSNPNIYADTVRPYQADIFWDSYQKYGIEALERTYRTYLPSTAKKIELLIKRIIRKMLFIK